MHKIAKQIFKSHITHIMSILMSFFSHFLLKLHFYVCFSCFSHFQILTSLSTGTLFSIIWETQIGQIQTKLRKLCLPQNFGL